MDVSVDTTQQVDADALLNFVQNDLVQADTPEGGRTGYRAELRESHLGTFKFDLKREGEGEAEGKSSLQVRVPTHGCKETGAVWYLSMLSCTGHIFACVIPCSFLACSRPSKRGETT